VGQAEFDQMPEPVVLRLVSHDGQVLVTLGRSEGPRVFRTAELVVLCGGLLPVQVLVADLIRGSIAEP